MSLGVNKLSGMEGPLFIPVLIETNSEQLQFSHHNFLLTKDTEHAKRYTHMHIDENIVTH